jgi:hypothetical protein
MRGMSPPRQQPLSKENQILTSAKLRNPRASMIVRAPPICPKRIPAGAPVLRPYPAARLAKPQDRASLSLRRSRGLLPAELGLAGATGSIMTGLPTVGGSLVGLLLAMARRTALVP